jgi:MFS family permease
VDRSHKLTWGMIAGATAFCTGPYAFTVIRFLLGLAEAGFYPGRPRKAQEQCSPGSYSLDGGARMTDKGA